MSQAAMFLLVLTLAARKILRRKKLRLDVERGAKLEEPVGEDVKINLGETSSGLRFWERVDDQEELGDEDGPDINASITKEDKRDEKGLVTTDGRPIDNRHDLEPPANMSSITPAAATPPQASLRLAPSLWHPASPGTPFIPLAPYQSDIRRWGLALGLLPLQDYRQNTLLLADHVGNLPRFEGVAGQWPMYFAFAVTGFIYGGLHCLAWNVAFPTELERMFWRLSSVTVSSTGILLVLVYTWELMPPIWSDSLKFFEVLGTLLDNTRRFVAKLPVSKNRTSMKEARFRSLFRPLVFLPSVLLGLLKTLYDISLVVFMVFYCFARLYLVVESFISLAHLQDSVYQLPKWSQYMPHIG